MLPIRTILHATDFSENSALAFQLACSLARDYGARLHVLHVARQPAVTPIGEFLPPVPERYEKELTAQLCGLHARESTVHMEPRLIFADGVASGILRMAQQLQPDLIVLGTHGRTGLGRLLMGSVAEQVVRKAPRPVLTVKTTASLSSPASAPVPDQVVRTVAAPKV